MFREDLLYRLNVLRIEVPSLAERKEDLPELADHILAKISALRNGPSIQIAQDAIDSITQYTWPGNIRELENVLERASAFCKKNVIKSSDLNFDQISPKKEAPSQLAEQQKPASLAGKTFEEIEKIAIQDTLEHCDGNRAIAARMLGTSEKTIYNKIKKYGL